MNPTTIGALLDAFDGLVRAIVPSVEAYREHIWRTVDDIDTVKGGEIRTFFINATSPVPVRDGIYSPSFIEHETTIRVYTSYANLRRRLKESLSGEDARQIWLAWDVRRAPIVAGLISVEHVGWEEENDEQSILWGAHTFEVRFGAAGVET